MTPLYEDAVFTFRFADDRVIPRFHLEAVPAGRRVDVFKIDPGSGARLAFLTTAVVGDHGWVELSEPIVVRAGEAFIAAPVQDTPTVGNWRALCRAVPETFDRAITQTPRSVPIRVDLAQEQHRAYVAALTSRGLQVDVLPADARFPDCCFVEDCAVHADGVALITRPGAPSRRGEQQAVAAALAPHVRLESLEEPATLDGGDCLRLGNRWFVGRSQRTNAEGVAGLRRVFEPLGFEVIEVPLGPALHLKCVCATLGDSAMLLAEDSVPAHVFGDVRIVPVPAHEAYAANCLCVDRTVLMPAGFSMTRRFIEAEGFEVRELDMSEFRKADGSMSCLSILHD